MTELFIRSYRPTDETAVISLWQRCKLTRPWNNPKQDIARKLRVDPDLFLVGELEGRVVASVMGGYEGHRGWVNYLAVEPEQRRRGFGRALMRAVEAKIEAKGGPKVNLQVREDNLDVIAFYERIGYKLDGVAGMGKRLVEDEPFRINDSIT